LRQGKEGAGIPFVLNTLMVVGIFMHAGWTFEARAPGSGMG
jgi:hypothetical protein